MGKLKSAKDGGVENHYRVFRVKNSKFKNVQGRQSIYNICILNYCKLTFEFFKNYIFEKHRTFLKRPVSCTFGESSVNGRLMFSQLVIFNVAKKSHRNKKLDKNQQRLSGKE